MKKIFSRKFSTLMVLAGIFGLFGLAFPNFDFSRAEAYGAHRGKWVKIDKTQMSCGAGVKTFSGTANFQGSKQDHLVVKLDNDQKVDRHDEPSTWSFVTYVGLGNHKLKAYIYDEPNTDSDNHSGGHKDKEAEDEWSFEVKKCPKPSPSPSPSPSPTSSPPTKIDCQWSEWGSCILGEARECGMETGARTAMNSCIPEEVRECGMGTRTRTIIQEAQNGGEQCQGPATESCEITCDDNDDDECDEGDENCGNIEVSPPPSPTSEPTPTPTSEPTPTPTPEPTPAPSTPSKKDDSDDGNHGGGRGGSETREQVLGTTTLASTGNAWTEVAQAVMALGAGMVVPATYVLAKIKE